MALRAFTMPKWGIEMQQGTLAEWLVKEGEPFAKGQLLALIETDKITNEVEAEAPGMLRKLIAQPGETLPVGALLGVYGDAGDDQAAVDAFADSFKAADTSTAVGRGAPPPPAPKAPAAAAAAPKPAAARVAIPDDLAISPEARRLAEEEGIDVSAIAGTGRGGRITHQDVTRALRGQADPIGGEPVSTAVGTEGLDGFYASPLAKRLAVQHGIDLAGISGTGPRGRISKADVLAKLPTPAAAPAATASPAPADNTPMIEPMSSLRKTIARRLTEAKQSIPHFYLRTEVTVDALLALRPTANMILGVKASVNDYLVRAVALALVEVPDVNIQVHGDAIHRFPHADVAVAVASEKGLVTPIVRGADGLRLDALSAAIKALVAKAQAGKLAADDISGGTFTVSNLGMFGLDQFDAIINPPQGAILAVGASRKVFAPGPDGEGRFETRIALSLSCDHRAIDGATGAKFLAALKAIVEEPTRLF
ncbi:2-oxo acid dehydrogenase subunit E2 [Sphingomonas profundi]|uniref:2-oxo acid dehydrogenase subunit E2 n=1 Tax=Alterirhizorhabdus profundi TaxID=2681549 RepID=UPI0030D5CFF9